MDRKKELIIIGTTICKLTKKYLKRNYSKLLTQLIK